MVVTLMVCSKLGLSFFCDSKSIGDDIENIFNWKCGALRQNPLVRSAALLSLIYLCAWWDDLSTEAMDGLSGGMISVLRQWIVSVVGRSQYWGNGWSQWWDDLSTEAMDGLSGGMISVVWSQLAQWSWFKTHVSGEIRIISGLKALILTWYKDKSLILS